MALRKPLVLIDGHIGQIPAGDTLDATVIAIDVIEMTNGESITIAQGQPVYVADTDTVKLAQANTLATAKVIGLAREDLAAGTTGSIQVDGILEMLDWSNILADGSASLTAGADYFLDPVNAGKLTEVPPSAVGQYLVYIGRAISTTAIELEIARPIIL